MVSRRLRWTAEKGVLLGMSLVLAVLALGGCGDDDGNGTTTATANQDTLDKASATVSRSATAAAEQVKSRYLPGPMVMKLVCSGPDPPPPAQSAYQISCHVEGFGTPPDGSGVKYTTSEDWSVPVDGNGAVGEPVRAGPARIRTYRRLDNRFNCTNHAARQEKCIPETGALVP